MHVVVCGVEGALPGLGPSMGLLVTADAASSTRAGPSRAQLVETLARSGTGG